MGRVTVRTPVTRLELRPDGGVARTRRPDTLTAEEPLEVRVGGRPLTVTMRTPGDDFDLTIGFLVGEGLVAGADDVATLVHCQDEGEDGRPTYNVVDVVLRDGVVLPDVGLERSFYATSSCGVCGKASLDAVRVQSRFDVAADRTTWPAATLLGLPDALRAHQRVFDRTGGLHAAGLATPAGELLVVREDVGRHNAVDKVVGWAAREVGLPLTGHVLVVSGRASFELTQKAVLAGVPCLVAVSAPSSLAVALAGEAGLTLAGFVRPPRMSLYAGEQRVVLPEGVPALSR